MKRAIAIIALVVLLGFSAGCYTPQFMPAVSVSCRVIDGESKKPIAGADLYLVYIGANGRTAKHGPFHTDAYGQGTIIVERQTLWQSGTDAYFVGGYRRSISVEMAGYEGSGFAEGFAPDLIEKKAPFVFELQPFKNRFGAVRVLNDESDHDTNDSTQRLDLLVLDGPHAGERFALPVFFMKATVSLKGKKLYLRKSLDEIRTEMGYVIAWNEELILREGLSDEPYTPDKKPQQEATPTERRLR